MKKIFLFLFILFSINIFVIAQQQKQLTVHCNFPKQLKTGNKINLKVTVAHHLSKEQTGNVTLELFDAITNKSVDGWFLNIFPFQYFTSIAGENFNTSFPFTVPSNFNGKIKIVIKAVCGNAKDSLAQTFTVSSKITGNE
ncbi:MAG TPA: hypothetical protein VHP12_09045 [Chitinophagaceae bacterium]|nr:hypothetical protein [Chitinophagaceae bacterium]